MALPGSPHTPSEVKNSLGTAILQVAPPASHATHSPGSPRHL